VIRGLIWVAAVVLAAVIVRALLVPGTDWLARHDIGSSKGPLAAARDAARGRLLTLGAGLLAAGALVFTGQTFILSRRTFELTEQGQVTDRYTKAIGQLGSDKLDVRIGGIYALERIARDSAKDHPAVMEVLTAFIREHSRELWPVDSDGVQDGEKETRPDVQAAVAVVGRRNTERDIRVIDLFAADLTGAVLTRADLSGATLDGAVLTRADLTGAYLVGADLTGATLHDAVLTGAVLTRVNLEGAHLEGAHLDGATLRDAVLTGADLRDAVLTGAALVRANLTGADLYKAVLTRVSLAGANLTEARLLSAHLDGATLINTVLTRADLRDADLTRATLSTGILRSADLTKSSGRNERQFRTAG
jgi:hypothetical protein